MLYWFLPITIGGGGGGKFPFALEPKNYLGGPNHDLDNLYDLLLYISLFLKLTVHSTYTEMLQINEQASRWRVKTANTILQIHLHEVNILQIHNARPEFVKKYHGY